MPKRFLNAFNQPVIEYDWDEFLKRLKQRLPYTGHEDLSGRTIVIKHTWGLGDLLYMSSAIKGLRERYPRDAEHPEKNLRIICIASFPDVLENNPDIDELYHWTAFEDFMELGDKLNEDTWYFVNFDVPLKGGFDYKVHLRTKPYMNEYLRSLLEKDPATLSGDEKDFYNQASNTVINRYKMIALDMYCAHLHVDPVVKSIHYYPYQSELDFADNFLKKIRSGGNKAIVLIPHTSTTYKDYPHWKEVIKLCPWNYFWLILGSRPYPNESWIGRNVYDCIGAFNFRASAALTIQSDLCCSSDTGLLYTKAARGGKCVVTYGPHEPEPFLHYFPSAHGLRVEKLTRTPGMENMCSVGCYIDTEGCHEKGTPPPCLQELDPQVVAHKIQEVIESNS